MRPLIRSGEVLAVTGSFDPRNNSFFWIFAAIFVVLTAFFLFWAQPLFLGGGGAQSQLRARAARLRAAPPGAAAAEVGRLVKSFLDASKHASRVEVTVEEASPGRLAFTLTVPWAVSSGKIHRRRGETTARLAASLLKSAGVAQTGVEVRVRRMRKSAGGSEPAGRAAYYPVSEKVTWRVPGDSSAGD
jgi:hypothetical protein